MNISSQLRILGYKPGPSLGNGYDVVVVGGEISACSRDLPTPEQLSSVAADSILLDEINATRAIRAPLYPPVQDQLDAWGKGGESEAAMKSKLAKIKADHAFTAAQLDFKSRYPDL